MSNISTSGRSRGNTPAKPRPAPAKIEKTVLEIETGEGTFITDCKNQALESIIKYGKPVTVRLKRMTDKEYFSNPATNESAKFFA